MASRYYASRRPTTQQFFAPLGGTWTRTSVDLERLWGYQHWSFEAATSKLQGGGVSTFPVIANTGVGPYDIDCLMLRFALPRMAAQTITGTLDLVLASRSSIQNGNGNTITWKVHAYVARYNASRDAWENVGTLLNNYVDATAFTDDGASRFYGFTAPQALTPVTMQAGDRPVIEVGFRAHNPNTDPAVGSNTDQLRLTSGTTDFGGVAQADAAVGDTAVTARAGYFDWSHTFTEEAATAAPANDACADATVIASLPYAIGPIDVSGSTDTDEAVWWSWTADEDCRVILSTLGSTYDTAIDVFSGICGALGANRCTDDPLNEWIGWNQNVGRFDAVSGTTYLIRVTNLDSILAAGALMLKVVKRRAPVTNDLFVNCQHIVGLRAGVLCNAQTDFFGFTPTGAAIDYTLRALVDQNGGTHIGERLVVQLFDSDVVEFLDLTTLNVAQQEVTFIPLFDIAAYPANAYQSSLVFDRAGDLILGYFGDGYDVQGSLSTPPTYYVRRLLGNITETNVAPTVSQTAVYPVTQDVMGSDYVDVDSSTGQTILWYTSAGTKVKRWDMSANAALPDFATVAALPGPRPGLRGLRLLPPGDGSGGMLVTAGSAVLRLNAAGIVTQTYTPAATHRAQDLDKVELNQAGDTFWVSDQLSTSIFEFDLASGAELSETRHYLPSGQLSGFVVYNGFRAGVEPPPPPPPPPEEPGHGCPVTFPIDPGGSGHGCAVPFLP